MTNASKNNAAKYKWLVVFFVHEIMEYTQETDKLLNELANSIIVREKGIKVIVLFDAVSLGKDDKYHFEYSCREFFKRTDIASVTPDYRNPLPTSIDLSKQNAWQPAFRFIFSEFTAEKRILLTWSHGNGFGIHFDGHSADQGPINDFSIVSNDVYFVDREYIRPCNIPTMRSEKIIEQQEFFAFTKKNHPPCTKLNLLWVQTLARSLQNSLPDGEKIDILMMVNCNMQLIDNAITLSENVKYLVAAESVFAACGYNYVRLLSLLQRHPYITDKTLCKQIVKDYVDKYLFDVQDGREIIKDNSLFVNKLANADKLLDIVNMAAVELIQLIKDPETKDIIEKIRTTRLNDVSTLGSGFVDLGLLLKKLAKGLPARNKFKGYYKYYKSTLKKTVIAKHVGDNYLLEDMCNKQKYGLTGFSIYFPLDKSNFHNDITVACAYYNTCTMTRFAKLSTWDEFLIQYFAG